MLKTKKRNIFHNLIGDIEKKIQQDGGLSFGFKKSNKNTVLNFKQINKDLVNLLDELLIKVNESI